MKLEAHWPPCCRTSGPRCSMAAPTCLDSRTRPRSSPRPDPSWPGDQGGRARARRRGPTRRHRCVNVGEMQISPFEAAFGFHERHVVENKDDDAVARRDRTRLGWIGRSRHGRARGDVQWVIPGHVTDCERHELGGTGRGRQPAAFHRRQVTANRFVSRMGAPETKSASVTACFSSSVIAPAGAVTRADPPPDRAGFRSGQTASGRQVPRDSLAL